MTYVYNKNVAHSFADDIVDSFRGRTSRVEHTRTITGDIDENRQYPLLMLLITMETGSSYLARKMHRMSTAPAGRAL